MANVAAAKDLTMSINLEFEANDNVMQNNSKGKKEAAPLKGLLICITTLMLTVPIVPLYDIGGNPSPINNVAGSIIYDDIDIIEILPAKDKNKTITLAVSDYTYIADAINGKPMSLTERRDDKIVAYYYMNEFGEYEAIALIVDIPDDFVPPIYAQVSRASHNGDEISVVTDRGVIVTIHIDTPIEPFLTYDIVSIDDIIDGTDLLLWNQAITMSIPARTTANKVVILSS